MRAVKRVLTIIRKRTQSVLSRVVFLLLLGTYLKCALNLCEYFYNPDGATFAEATQTYGLLLTVILYSLTAPVYLNVPVTFFNLLGWVLYNPFSKVKRNKQIPTETPFICFRVVTRGLFPKLVAEVTEKNLDTCRNFGIKNFKFEIVTDNALNMQPSNCIREVIVPSDYRAPNGSLFKARALHYCLNRSINILSPDDWIVHLDEETLLTESVLCGIVNFVSEPMSNIGQGVITYGQSGIENWLTTLLDGIRVGIDYGLFRFGLQCFHRPVFGFKGSFVVVKMGIEEKIGFDFGPKECIAEDLRFALAAWQAGYRFDFVEGVMKEKSTFSLGDYVKQRKRWFIGHFHIVWGNTLPLLYKCAVLPMHIGNILLWMNVITPYTSFFLPVPMAKWQLFVFFYLSFNACFMLAFGNFMSLCSRRYSVLSRFIIGFLAQALVPFLGVIEAYSTLNGLRDRNKIKFDIVQKETTEQLNHKMPSEIISI